MSEPTVAAYVRPEQPAAVYLEFKNEEALNAFTIDMWRSLIKHLREARKDDSKRVVVLRGAGSKAFSSGLAMQMLDNLKCDEDYALIHTLGMEVRECIFNMGKPVIAAVNGYCIGGGFEIALCCDLVYASEDAKFALPELNIGLIPGCGGAVHLPEKIPVNRAFEMILFGERMSADEAKSYGFVNRIFPKESFFPEVDKLVDIIAAKAPLAVRGLKEIMSHSNLTGDRSAAILAERRLSIDLMNSKDFKNAVKAFREKRTPEFKGE